MRRFVRVVTACALLISITAYAQEGDGAETSSGAPASYGGGRGKGSVLAGSTVGGGATVLHAQLGWPGLSVSLLYGAGPKLDLGGQLSLVYGYEGITRLGGIPGMRLEGILRLSLLERQRINLGLEFEPGLVFYFYRGYAEIGLALPVSLNMGIALGNQVMLNVGLDMPMFLGPYGGILSFLLGGGIEYALDPSLALTFNLRIGPAATLGYYYDPYYYCSYDRFGRPISCGVALVAFESLIGLAYRF